MHLKETPQSGPKILQGNEACALAAIYADCKFFAGYPITPASEVPEYMAGKLLEAGGSFIQMEDELASICAIIGAAWGGARAMTATSGPGFSLMQEAIGYAIVGETPIVILDVQRGGPSTGQPTSSSQHDVMQSRFGSHGDYEIIALAPASVQECFDFTVRAFNLADKYRVPVIILTDEQVGHMREKIELPSAVEIFDDKFEGICNEYYKPDDMGIPPRIRFYEGHAALVDGQLHDEKSIRAGHLADVSAAAVRRYCSKITDNVDDICDVESYMVEDADLVVLAYGCVSRSAKSAVNAARAQGLKVGLVKPNVLWPAPVKEIETLCKNAKKVLVPEMNIGQYIREVQRIVGPEKTVGMPSLGGVLHHPDDILNKMKEVLA